MTAQPEGSWRDLYPFDSHRVEVDGHAMHYLDEGEGPLVVMVHGNPTWSFFYRNLCLALRGSCRVVVPDHLGCGLSDRGSATGHFRLADRIRHLEALLDRVAPDEPLSLIVHDWGGAIGTGFAVRHPDRVRRLMAMNTAAFLGLSCPLRIRICRTPVLGRWAVQGLNAFARAALTMAVGPGRRLSAAVRAGYLHPYDSWRRRGAIHQFVLDIPLHPSHPTWQALADIESSLPALHNTPMLLAWGMRDFCFTPHFLDRWIEIFPQAAVHRFPDAGHYLLEDEADAIARIAADFLSC